MQFSVTFRHMEATDAIKEYAREKVDRVKKYFPDPIMVHVVLSTERGYQHAADVNIQLHNGLVIKGHETTEDMYSSIDLVMAKIERQVRRFKEKIRGHKARADLSTIPIMHHILEPDTTEAATAAMQTSSAPVHVEAERKVVRTEKVFARPLSVNEAILQLNLLGDLFLVFRHEKSGQITVVYKRNDGAYGLIETGQSS